MSLSARIGPLESRLLGWSQMVARTRVRTSEVAETLRISPKRASELLDRMARDGMAIQLQRGLYLLPEKLPPGGRWQPPATVALWHFFEARGAVWQETGPNAFNYHGLTEQLANETFAYNDKVSGKRHFGRLPVTLIKVSRERLGHAAVVKIGQDRIERRRIGTLPRAVFDAVYDYKRFGTLPKAYDWILQRRYDEKFLIGLVRCCTKYGNLATARRIGWLLDTMEIDEAILRPLLRMVTDTTAYIPLDPYEPARGDRNRCWGIVDNWLLPDGNHEH
jgi:predicted transcriptional regulator of viral defense system